MHSAQRAVGVLADNEVKVVKSTTASKVFVPVHVLLLESNKAVEFCTQVFELPHTYWYPTPPVTNITSSEGSALLPPWHVAGKEATVLMVVGT
jgi:hypothetical protein